MATYTSNLNLEKPLQTELYNVDVFNANFDKIDAGVGARVEYTDALTLEEIIASTDLTNKVAAASAAKSLRESLSKIKSGTVTIEFNNQSSQSANVTFNTPMPNSNYAVTCIARGGNMAYRFFISVTDEATTGFRLYVTTDDLSPITATRNFDWIAVPMQS